MPSSNDLEISGYDTSLVSGFEDRTSQIELGNVVAKDSGGGGGGNIVPHQEYRLYKRRWAGVIAIVCTSVVPRLSVSASIHLSLYH